MELGLEGWVANTAGWLGPLRRGGPARPARGPARAIARGPCRGHGRARQRGVDAGDRDARAVRRAKRGASGRLRAGPIGQRAPDRWAIPCNTRQASTYETMEPNSAAEDLPALYRAVLDRVAQLEASGQARPRQPDPGRRDAHLFEVVGRSRQARPRGAPPAPRGGRPGRPNSRPRPPPADLPRRLTTAAAPAAYASRSVSRDDPRRHRTRTRRLSRARRSSARRSRTSGPTSPT